MDESWGLGRRKPVVVGSVGRLAWQNPVELKMREHEHRLSGRVRRSEHCRCD